MGGEFGPDMSAETLDGREEWLGDEEKVLTIAEEKSWEQSVKDKVRRTAKTLLLFSALAFAGCSKSNDQEITQREVTQKAGKGAPTISLGGRVEKGVSTIRAEERKKARRARINKGRFDDGNFVEYDADAQAAIHEKDLEREDEMNAESDKRIKILKDSVLKTVEDFKTNKFNLHVYRGSDWNHNRYSNESDKYVNEEKKFFEDQVADSLLYDTWKSESKKPNNDAYYNAYKFIDTDEEYRTDVESWDNKRSFRFCQNIVSDDKEFRDAYEKKFGVKIIKRPGSEFQHP